MYSKAGLAYTLPDIFLTMLSFGMTRTYHLQLWLILCNFNGTSTED